MRPTIEVCLSPDLVGHYDFTNKTAVIIDIFRATSCMVAGLDAGVASIKAVATIEECQPYKAKGYVTAGERGGMKIEGFDIGNSIQEFKQQIGKKVVMTTTNGTQAIEKVRHKSPASIAIGAFLNLDALVEYVVSQDKNVVLVCAGWRGRYSLEDATFAGAAAKRLLYEKFEIDQDDDAAMSSLVLYNQNKKNSDMGLSAGGHFKRLMKLGASSDIEYALQKSIVNIVPVLKEDGEIGII